MDAANNIRSGICRGGPLSGQPLHHPEERLFLFKRDKKLISYTMPDAGPSALPPEIEVGAYEWDGSQWQWTREID